MSFNGSFRRYHLNEARRMMRQEAAIERIERRIERRAKRQSENNENHAVAGETGVSLDSAPVSSQDTPATAFNPTSWPNVEVLTDLSEHQKEQYSRAANGYLSILGGRPGTGKTYTLARIIKSLPKSRLAVCGPTGKAAVRVTETLRRAGVDGITATTTHTLLDPDCSDDGEWSFQHDENHPLDLDWIFCDEGSMYDVSLFGSLLAARGTGCRVMLIGDVNQLSPVGHGAPLRDLIASGLPYGELTEIQRNAGRIVRCCHEIIDRHAFAPSDKLDLEAESPENLLHVERNEPEDQIIAVKSILEKFRNGSTISVRDRDGNIIKRRVDPVWDVQLLVPVNDRSPLAREKINAIFQGFLNPCGEQAKGSRFRVGDKIVNGKNGKFPIEYRDMGLAGKFNEDQTDGKVYVANGEQAQVLAVYDSYTVARLWLPDRIVRIPRSAVGASDSSDGKSLASGDTWDLAYALSTHKSQGSQWPVVITLADSYMGARMLCDRCWIYTALSRAETLAITVGRRDVIDDMCRKSHIWERKTFLRETIDELRNASLPSDWNSVLFK